MKLPPLKIGELIARIPIIQGGMGVGVSLSNLSSADTINELENITTPNSIMNIMYS